MKIFVYTYEQKEGCAIVYFDKEMTLGQYKKLCKVEDNKWVPQQTLEFGSLAAANAAGIFICKIEDYLSRSDDYDYNDYLYL